MEDSEGLPTSPTDAIDPDEYQAYFEALSPEELDEVIDGLDGYANTILVGGAVAKSAKDLVGYIRPDLIAAIPPIATRVTGGVGAGLALTAVAAKGISGIAKDVRSGRSTDSGE